eukprot:GFUD01013494.1.p1 GENE.GFUD01013494.1~~GFUD01013494.1.p1  ORF type:complete len:469 (+),score=98.33 GFUD01013494.1:1120-2526(+)
MAGNNPRKFKDRIALLEQKQAESTAQFQAVMRDVSEVKKPQPFPTNFETGQAIGGEGLMIPRHLSPGLPTHHPHYRYGGSLPNVNQMASAAAAASSAGSQDPQNTLQGLPSMPQSVPLDHHSQFMMNPAAYGDGGQMGGPDRSRGGGTIGGGGAMRNRSGERRWDTSPYGTDRGYYSSSLSTYLSPPPESRWRRTSSDSALYQKLNQPHPNQKVSSEHGSPDYGSVNEDIKPPPELLNNLLLKEGDLLPVKEEPPSNLTNMTNMNGGGMDAYQHATKSPQVPCTTGQPTSNPNSPLSPVTLSPPCRPRMQHGLDLHQQYHSGSTSPIYQQPYMPPQTNNLEQEFQRFRLDCPPHGQYQDTGGNLIINNPGTPTTGKGKLNGYGFWDQTLKETIQGPTSPHTPSALPDIYIQDYSQDWSQDCDKGLDADFVETLREGLEPIDDQLLATLTGTGGTFVDPAVEEQFKMNH